MCLDKGYDFPEVYELLEEYGYTIHIPLRGMKRRSSKMIPGYRSKQWVVERTHSRMNRFRLLLIRWKKKVENHMQCYIMLVPGLLTEEQEFSDRLLDLSLESLRDYINTVMDSE